MFSIKDGIWALVLPLIIFVGIFSGVFSATEAGAVASVYALFVELFIYRELTKTDLWNIMVESGVITASFLIIVAAASTFTDYLALEEIPLKVTTAVISIIKSKWIFLLFVNLILLIVGTFIDVISAIVLLCPIFIPLLVQFKIDPIHFGIIMVLNLGIGYITPPLGLNLFVSAAMNKEPVYEISKAILPSFILLIIALLIITYIPKFTLFIPNLLFK
ncbi:MAG: TRAP transporter large permease [Deltaproteobacteria bacterium]|nr:TRAP transporter large permease [Deltaproteobacteria bacterium]